MTIQYVLLRYLVEGSRHGYALQKQIAELKDAYPVSNVNVYPILHDLEREGLIESELQVSASRTRKVYEITLKGRDALHQWLREPPESPVPEVRDVAYLKLLLATPESKGFGWLRAVADQAKSEAKRLSLATGRSSLSPAPLAALAARERISSLERRGSFLEEAIRCTESSEES